MPFFDNCFIELNIVGGRKATVRGDSVKEFYNAVALHEGHGQFKYMDFPVASWRWNGDTVWNIPKGGRDGL